MLWGLLLILLIHYTLVGSLATLYNTGQPNSINDQYIVVLLPNTSLAIRDAHVHSLKQQFAFREEGEEVLHSYHFGTFIGFSAILSKDILAEQLQHPDVLWIEQDSIATIYDEAPDEDIITQRNATWGLDRISKRYLPLDNTFRYWESAGSGVISYIIDTGIWITHKEFEGRASFGTNTVGDGVTSDANGHGTQVAGIVGGATYGVAKKTTLISVIVISASGSNTWSTVIVGLQWVVEDFQRRGKPKSVANMSLGGGRSPSADAAIAQAIEAGIHFAIAAGNLNDDACTISPSRVTTALVAGATNIVDARASFSNWGPCVDLFAPGVNITSAWIGNNTAIRTSSGTSFSAPHVAGAIALHLGHIPTYPTTKEVHDWFNKHATTDVVSDPRNSPNRFLYSPIEDL